MSTSDAVILGLIQGLTEFLPVSSDGHLVAARILFGLSADGGIAFDAWLHIGTLLAVIVYFWDVWRQLRRELIVKLAAATLPGAVAGYWLRNEGAWLQSPAITAAGFLVSAGVLFIIERSRAEDARGEVTLRDAWIMGLAQAAALLPGLSRSGVTIAAGCARGVRRQTAAIFSFLMSAPIVAGAASLSLPAAVAGGVSNWHLLLGAAISFATGLFAIRLFMRLIERASLVPFALYLVFLAAVLGWYAW
jgi:undecaprenyl-diphosphatase